MKQNEVLFIAKSLHFKQIVNIIDIIL